MKIEIELNPEEAAAFEAFRQGHGRLYTEPTAARLLVRDELTRMGLLPLPRQNRSRWAGKRRK
jgi:hypothetical protein